ncbi:MAG: CheY-like chemotaxis protein [Pirellulaceae bacterium]
MDRTQREKRQVTFCLKEAGMIQDALPELEADEAEETRERTILIVDDDESQVAALCHRFESLGYRTLAAYEGKRGIDVAETRHPDIVLLDVGLPDITGFEVCEHLNNSAMTCDIPIIVVSGHERTDVVRRARAAGGMFFLQKPYDPNSLLALVEHALREPDCW